MYSYCKYVRRAQNNRLTEWLIHGFTVLNALIDFASKDLETHAKYVRCHGDNLCQGELQEIRFRRLLMAPTNRNATPYSLPVGRLPFGSFVDSSMPAGPFSDSGRPFHRSEATKKIQDMSRIMARLFAYR
jgi:hypothetical protein